MAIDTFRIVDFVRWVLLFFTATFLSTPNALAEQKVLQFFTLAHRPAENIIPFIRPFLDESDTVIANGSQIIVKVDRQNISEITKLIEALDTPLRRLLITVLQGRDIRLEDLNTQGQVAAKVSSSKHNDTNVRLKARYHHYRTKEKTRQTQTIQTMDGQAAFIKFGEDRPIPRYLISEHRNPRVVAPGIEYREISTGFGVIPRLVGQRVLLDFAPWSQNLSNLGDGTIETQSAHSVIESKLGEWIELGGEHENHSSSRSDTLTKGYNSSNKQHQIFIKIDEILDD